MKPMELEIAGWGPYKGVQKIDFTALGERGIFLITGPTGAGKTTIFDAVSFALYGTLSGQMREKNSVRSDFADALDKTYVNLKLMHRGEVYEVYRNPEYMRPKKRKNTGKAETVKERENAVLTMPDGRCVEGAGEVTRKLQELLSMDYRQFKQVSMIAQGEFAKLLTESPAEKIRIFRELFGTDRLEQFTARLRAKANGLYKEVMEYRHKMDEDLNLLQEEEASWEMLIGAEERNYDEIFAYLKKKKAHYREKLKAAELAYTGLEVMEKDLSEKLLKMRGQNEKIETWEKKRQELLELEAEEENYRKKQEQAERIRRAQRAEAEYIHYKNAAEQLQENKQSLKRLEEETAEIEKKLQRNSIFQEQQEWFSMLAGIQKEKIDCESQLRKMKKELAEKEGELADVRKAYIQAQKESRKGRERLEEAEEQYRFSAIGIVVSMLEKGKPCPVCGSLEHPKKAEKTEGITDEKEWKRLRSSYEKLQDEMMRVHEKALCLQAQQKTLEEQLAEKQSSFDEAEKKEKELTGKLWEEAGQTQILMEWLALSPEKKQQVLEEGRAAWQQSRALLDDKRKQCGEQKTERARKEASLKEMEARFQKALKQQKIESETEFLFLLEKREEGSRMEAETAEYMEKLASMTNLVNHLGQETEGKTREDTAETERKLQECGGEKKKAAEQRVFFGQKKAEIIKILNAAREKQEKMQTLSGKYGIVRDLDQLASGNNARRLVFEQYVLAVYFEQVLEAANVRFRKMTAGRYEMFRSGEVTDGRTKDSLEIRVLDYYTGKARSVKTLSGGETFKASLSLALGLSDVIGRNSGGICVDTLFIDEGFGALDGESLDSACETLSSLVEKDRLIGIISHVPELRERIESQIVICKTSSGSRIENVIV